MQEKFLDFLKKNSIAREFKKPQDRDSLEVTSQALPI